MSGDGLVTSRDAVADEHPLREMLRIAAPTVATMTSYTLMTFVDGLVASRIGPDPVYVAAQGNGNVASFVPISIVMGAVGVVNTYVSQNLGAGKAGRGPAYAWNGLWIVAMAWLAMMPYAAAIPWFFAGDGHEARLMELETRYARILLCGSILTMSTRSIAQFFYGMHRPNVVFIAAVAGNLTNLFANLVLVFGAAGAPESVVTLAGHGGAYIIGPVVHAARAVAETLGVQGLGLTGSAFGTLIGSAVELSIPLCVFLGPAYNRLYGTRSAWRPSSGHLRDIARLGWPAGLMFGNEIVCWAIFMTRLVGRFGTEHNAAGWIALRYMHLSFMPAVGISYAVTALVGKCMGRRRPDLAARRAGLGVAITMVYMGTCALAFVLFPRAMVGFFIEPTTSGAEREAILRIGYGVMMIAAVFQVFDAMGITMIGALRGAGDTVWPGAVTIILSWTCIVGVGGLLAWQRPEWGSLGPWAGSGLYIITLGLFLITRFLRGRWKDIRLVEPTSTPPGPLSPEAMDQSALAPLGEPIPAAPTGPDRAA